MKMLQHSIFIGACFLLTTLSGTKAAGGLLQCTNPECIKQTSLDYYTTQNNCTELQRGPTSDCRWKAGLNRRIDEIAYGGRIIAYKLQWFGGSWTNWFVPGFNDIDSKFNNGPSFLCSVPVPKNGMRRAWSYFFDHTHRFIICYN